jgi:predicted dehydrogenase
MRILVCGLGSMGKRRLGIIRRLLPNARICGVDPQKERAEAIRDMAEMTDTDFFKAFKAFDPEAVFVCSPPLTHSDVVLFSLDHGAHTFSEINLTDQGYDRVLHSAELNKKLAFLSSTFLYNKEIKWLIDRINTEGKMGYRYHTGQYLPDWHPWENYQDFFVSKKQTNALREIMAIEFPWIFKAFGRIADYKCMAQKISNLNLDYPDMVHLILKHENGSSGTITFDCVSVQAVRRLEVFNGTCFFEWGGTPGTLKSYCPEKKQAESVSVYEHAENNPDYAAFIIENPYVEEVETFFRLIQENIYDGAHGYDQDLKIIEFINRVEKEYEQGF